MVQVKSLRKINQRYYDKIWSYSRLMRHTEWPVWRLLKFSAKPGLKMLELGPGIRPKIPVKESFFIEISGVAKKLLEKQGGKILQPDQLSLKKNFFDTVCAFEVLEHIRDDERLLREINFSLKKGGKLFVSMPIFDKYWSDWDNVVGHYRRYLPKDLENLLTKAGFEILCFTEDSFARTYTGKMQQKLARIFFKKVPKVSLYLEGQFIRILCFYARNFSPLKWQKGKLSEIPETWAGVYIVSRKIKSETHRKD